MKNLRKPEFVDIIVKKCNITKAEASRAIEYFTKGVEEVLVKGDKLTLIGFGSFYVAENKAKIGRNPRTGEEVQIPASKSPKFKAGLALKQACKK